VRAAVIRTFGPADGIEVVDLADPVPRGDEVLVRVEAIGVGGVDAVIRRGTLGSSFPVGMVLGGEVAGTVAAVGPDGDPGLVGRRVWAFTGTAGGGYAELAVAAGHDVVPLPDALSAVDAVALGSAVPVARFGLARAGLRSGETLLVRGASGSIGIAAVEIAVRTGATVAVTTGSPARGERLRSLGAAHVLDRAGRGDASAPADFDVVLDVVGGPDLAASLDRLRPNGRMVAVGVVGGYPPADFGTALLRGFRRSISFGTLSLDTVPRTELHRARAEAFLDAVRGTMHAVVHDVLPLADAAVAHRRMDAGEVFGRLVLTP
jgi:NADPH:quinone reductase-like Zn-dependent oxidoreductase